MAFIRDITAGLSVLPLPFSGEDGSGCSSLGYSPEADLHS